MTRAARIATRTLCAVIVSPVAFGAVRELTTAAVAEEMRFTITSEANESLVSFLSKATTDTFRGKTRNVRGHFILDPAHVSDSVTVAVEVDLVSIDSGNADRDLNMRENHLHTARFPTTTFRGGRILKGAGTDLTGGGAHEVLLAGELDLHGVTRVLEVPVELEYREDNGQPCVRAKTTFPVLLSDHEIPRPRFLFLKLSQKQVVTLDLLGRAQETQASPDST
jgi:polyisoprenoid-binding protein YceI